MNPINKEALIKGVFTPEQAKEVLSTLFRSKIKMHSQSSFNSLIKTGQESDIDNSRKQELADSLDRLIKSIKTISDPELEVKLDCLVNMKFIKRKSKRK